jgi:hypothetical protein
VWNPFVARIEDIQPQLKETLFGTGSSLYIPVEAEEMAGVAEACHGTK